MTRADYEVIAGAINESLVRSPSAATDKGVRLTAVIIAERLGQANPAFDEQRFYDAAFAAGEM